MEFNATEFFYIVSRWTHFVAGIIWIGLLYFFNLVNVPYTKLAEPKDRAAHVPKLMPLALAWFRHAAWVTVLVGFALISRFWQDGDLFNTNTDKTIFTGMLLGVIMLFNVWAFIWPNQKKVIEATVKAEKPDPQWGKTALLASRTNFVLSFPMLFYMAGSTHYPMDWVGILIYGIVAAAIAAVLVLRVQK
jgi:uncharacterized membrane protein